VLPNGLFWYISPRFGILCQEKSGNPARELKISVSQSWLRNIVLLLSKNKTFFADR
jgi:hypothetical protein